MCPLEIDLLKLTFSKIRAQPHLCVTEGFQFYTNQLTLSAYKGDLVQYYLMVF